MSELNTAATNIYDRLAAAPTFHPANVDLFADWNVQSGDIVTVKSDLDSYQVPIYNMKLKWTGKPKVAVESTGNPEREPLPAIKRREYSANSSNYSAKKSLGSGVGNALNQTAEINGVLYAAGLQVDPVTGVWLYASEQGADYALGSSFKVQSDAITAEVNRATTAEGQMSSRITQTADAITAEVTRATAEEGTLSSRITQTADQISLKVSKGDVSTQLAVECGNVTISGGNLVVSGYITSQGLITTMGNFNGNISATGSIAGQSLAGGSITLNGESLTSHSITWMAGSLTMFAADQNLDLRHSHAVTVGSDGTVTLGEVSSTGGSFNIADTKTYKNGVSAAWTNAYNTVRINNNKDPGAGNKTINLGSGQSVEVYAQAKSNANASIWTTVGTVTVNAPTYTLGSLSIASNGIYNAPTYGYTGFSYVSVDVPSGPTITQCYTRNFSVSSISKYGDGYEVVGSVYVRVEFSDNTHTDYGPYTVRDVT